MGQWSMLWDFGSMAYVHSRLPFPFHLPGSILSHSSLTFGTWAPPGLPLTILFQQPSTPQWPGCEYAKDWS